jgi:hypothetical protein
MRWLAVLIVVILTVGFGCLRPPEPTVQPPIPQPVIQQQGWDGVTQYDYKAGAPNVYPTPPSTVNETTVNPYLITIHYPSIAEWLALRFPITVAPETMWMPYYPPYIPPVVTTIIWTGNVTITVIGEN